MHGGHRKLVWDVRATRDGQTTFRSGNGSCDRVVTPRRTPFLGRPLVTVSHEPTNPQTIRILASESCSTIVDGSLLKLSKFFPQDAVDDANRAVRDSERGGTDCRVRRRFLRV